MNHFNAKIEGWDREPAPGASADTTSEPPPADPGCAMTTLELFDAGLGSRLIPVTAPGGVIAPNSSLKPENLGKAPGRLGPAGWASFDLNSSKFRCHDHATAKLWASWNANTGFVTGDGYVVFDNDEGEDLDRIIERECRRAAGPGIALMRRFVRDPNHKRSAFVFRVLDFVGDTAAVGNQTLKFKRNGKKTELQVLAPGKQFVIGGMHPGTRAPYALSRRVSSISDIPIMSDDQLDEIVEGVIAGMKAIGCAWPRPPPIGTGLKTHFRNRSALRRERSCILTLPTDLRTSPKPSAPRLPTLKTPSARWRMTRP